jgi:hypothetical protein
LVCDSNTDDSGISIPLGYEIISKTENKYNEEFKKDTKKSMFTKNEIMRDKLKILHLNNHVKFKYVLFDKWFSSVQNLVYINEVMKKHFVCQLKLKHHKEIIYICVFVHL